MEVNNIQSQAANYDAFLLDALGIGDTATKEVDKSKEITENNSTSQAEKKAWQQKILSNAIDVLENNIQVDNDSPLFSAESAPIESYAEALDELRKLVDSDFEKNAVNAQANLTHSDILYLFEDQFDHLVV